MKNTKLTRKNATVSATYRPYSAYKRANEIATAHKGEIGTTAEGFGKDTEIHVTLHSGLITTSLIAAFDYEGGERLAFIRQMAEEKGVNPSALVVAWLTNLHRCKGFPRVIPLFSATVNHLVDNLKGLELTLTDEELERMNSI